MTAPQTRAGVFAELAKVQKFLEGHRFVKEHTIADYPIGRTARGQCKLAVEHKSGKGYRTVRSTTDKNDRWCKPKCSVYQEEGLIVVCIAKEGETAGWFRIDKSHVYVQSASGKNTIIATAPCSAVRRQAESFTLVSRSLVTGQEVDRQAVHLEADDAELVEAFDLWKQEISVIARQVLGVVLQEAM